MVHTYTDRLGPPPTFFAEGLASVLDCEPNLDFPNFGAPFTPALQRDVTDNAFFADLAAGYDGIIVGAGYFMRWMLESYGKSSVMRLVRSLPMNASQGDIDTAFRSILGTSLDDAFSAWGASKWTTSRTGDSRCLFILEGAGSPPAFEDQLALTPKCQDASSNIGFDPYAVLRLDVRTASGSDTAGASVAESPEVT